ncbi:hypothetical protein R1sor_000708 [Riccia sorocarpa]|uniref:P-type ATPase A domain-containing protein n=1 Tax=Riccia sorocarpa TaxID=122646 RepID=A0ABD3GVK8_9MARC
MGGGFPFEAGRLFGKHLPRNQCAGNDEEEWLFEDTSMVDRPPAAILSSPGHNSCPDSEKGPVITERSRISGSPREMSILDEDDQILEIKSAKFYRWSLLKDMGFLLSCVVTGGIAAVVSSTWPQVYVRLRFIEVTQTDEDAEHVLVESMDGSLTLADIQFICTKDDEKCWIRASRARFSSDESISSRPRMFIWREEHFWYNSHDGSWTRRGFNTDLTYAELHAVASNCALKEIGHDPEENKKSDSRERRSLVYGPNHLNVNVPSLWHLICLEIFRPFFLFQVFSVIFWICSDYEIYAYVILSLTIVTLLYGVVETRQNLLAVKNLAASECELKRLTLVADETAELRLRPVLVSSSELLPGDIVQIEAGMIFPCDLVLLVGQCVVNESMLTGESAPVPKTPLPLGHGAFGQVFRTQSERDGRYKLLSGTKALQIRASSNPHALFSSFEIEGDPPSSIWQFVSPRSTNLDPLVMKEEATPVAAMVISTAYGTAKGQLVRAILFPKPSKYDFEKKLYYFLANLGVYLILVCIVTIVWQAGKETGFQILKNCINLITIAVPPALPLALSIGLSVSFTRLKSKRVYCINPNRIINAGRVNTLCFDKTGTLTEDGLSLKGVIPIECTVSQEAQGAVRCGRMEEDVQALYREGKQALLSVQGNRSDDKTFMSSLGLFYTLAACHSISLMDEPSAESSSSKSQESAHEVSGKNCWGWKKWLVRFWKKCESVHKQIPEDSGLLVHEETVPPNLTDNFIGDPLEIQVFSRTGWTFLSRPDDPIVQEGDDSDPPITWASMPPSAETAIIPPVELNSHQVLAILRRFDFDPEIRLMSSIILEMPSSSTAFGEARAWVLVKGAPESLQEVCTSSSIPQDFTNQLQELTLSGYRVLACAYRLLGPINLQQVLVANRSQMETSLTFCGFVAMENKLKAETSGILLQLARAGLREVMVTGDNPLTAISVSRQCGPFFLRSSCRTFLIDRAPDSHAEMCKSGCFLKDVDSERESELDTLFQSLTGAGEVTASPGRESTLGMMGPVNLAVTGRAFNALSIQHDQLIEQHMEHSGSAHVKITDCVTPFQMILTQANIFSRMSPQNKLELMRGLQDLGYVVCMTGDGANDSGALKAADVGISIASKPVEASDIMAAGPSIAAPFSTKLAHIGVVPMILAEGRCALVNATVMFKYMYFYALIQATSVMVLYKYQLELFEYQYLWADLGLVFPMVLFMPATKPRKELTRGKPESNLLAVPILISVYGQSCFIMLFQAIAQVYLQHQTWYENPNDASRPRMPDEASFTLDHNQNSTVSFLFSSFQYISMAMALSQSFGMFRCSPLSNIPLIASMICLFVLSSLFMLKPMAFSMKAFSLVDLSQHENFLYWLWLLAVGNSLIFILYERYSVNHKSTELDMSNAQDEDVESGLSTRRSPTFHDVVTVLKGEGDTCTGPLRPVIPDFFRVSKVARPVWARVASI